MPLQGLELHHDDALIHARLIRLRQVASDVKASARLTVGALVDKPMSGQKAERTASMASFPVLSAAAKGLVSIARWLER